MSLLHVAFKVADANYVIPASMVVQMESFTGATRVPGAPDYVLGLVQVRGAVLPVVDLRARFRLPAREPTLDSRIVVVDCGGRRAALLVDSARDMLKFEPSAFESPPEVVANQASGFVRSVARVDDRLVMLIDCDRVLGENEIHDHHDSGHE